MLLKILPKPVQAEELLEQLQSYLGLEWIYETKQELIPQTRQVSTQVNEMVTPPSEELTALYKAARLCHPTPDGNRTITELYISFLYSKIV